MKINVGNIVHHVLDKYTEICLRKIKNKKKVNEKIRVAFITQVPGIWDKEEPIYNAMKKSGLFSTYLLVVPNVNQITKKMDSYDNNYFINKYPEAIKIVEELNEKSIKEYSFDYIFYPRPYDVWLPRKLRSTNLVKHAKCCYVPYGVRCEDTNIIRRSFIRNLSIFFASTIHEQKWAENYYSQYFEQGIRKSVYLGYPAIQECVDYIEDKHDKKRVLWTPRWSYDQEVGGSHFLEYKDGFINSAAQYCEVEWICRPHPLMFNNFIGRGVMTEKEVEDFKTSLDNNGIILDNAEDEIISIFKKVDILITDFSSIVGMFYAMKKPVIYCMSENIKLNVFYQRLLEGMYIAYSWEDVSHYLSMLLSGQDELKEKREAIWEEEFGVYKDDSVGSILEYIKKDYELEK